MELNKLNIATKGSDCPVNSLYNTVSQGSPLLSRRLPCRGILDNPRRLHQRSKEGAVIKRHVDFK